MTVTAYWGDENYAFGSSTRVTGSGIPYENLMWLFEVAWNGDFDFLGDNEAGRMIDLYSRVGRDQFVNYDGKGLARYSPGRMVVRLTNDDDKYDPNNASGEFYGEIEPGKYTQLSVLSPYEFIIDELGNFFVDENGDYIVTGNDRNDIFAGIIFDLQAIVDEQTRAKYIDITATDGWGWLREKYPIVAGDSDVTASAAAQSILDAAQWPLHWGSDLYDMSRNFPYFWGGAEDSRSILHEISESQEGFVYIGGEGKIHLRPRSNSPVVWKYYTTSDLVKNVEYTNPWENNFNLSQVIQHPYTPATAGGGGPNYLWVAGSDVDGQDLTMAYLDELDFEGDYSVITGGVPGTRSDIMVGLSPVPLWSVETASALDVSNYIHLISFEDAGTGFRARIKNYYPGTVYIIQFYILGNWVSPLGTVKFNDDRSAGMSKKIFISDSQYLLENVDASAIATAYANRVVNTGQLPEIELEQRPDIQYVLPMDKINLDFTATSNFYVRAVEHRSLSPNCQAIRTTIFMEPI